MRTMRRRFHKVALGTAILASSVGGAGCVPDAPAPGPTGPNLGFTAINTNALPCSATGMPKFAAGMDAPVKLMQAGDAATPVNAPAAFNKVGTENDMNALSPDGHYLYTPSEETPSDGVTRLTLKGPDAGKKELLTVHVDAAGTRLWKSADGAKWYPYGGPGTHGAGVLLIGEEVGEGGLWQVNPETGAYVRLDWTGTLSHEGVGLDDAGNLYYGAEERNGAIFKAVPNDKNDLTKGGKLYYMVGTGIDASGWKLVANPAVAQTEANNGGAILFDRPEDADERNGRIYFTATEPKGDADNRKGNYNGTAAGGVDANLNQVVNRGGIYSFKTAGVPELATQSGAMPKYNKITPMIEVNDPTYANQAQAQSQQGLQFPDNIAFDGKGNLWVHEDIPDSSPTAAFPASGIDVSKQLRNQQDELYVYVLNAAGDAIVKNPDTTGPNVSGGYKAADMQSSNAANACANEFTGGIFAADGKTLYINQQHVENPTLRTKIG